jgi:hypothetical protein
MVRCSTTIFGSTLCVLVDDSRRERVRRGRALEPIAGALLSRLVEDSSPFALRALARVKTRQPTSR